MWFRYVSPCFTIVHISLFNSFQHDVLHGSWCDCRPPRRYKSGETSANLLRRPGLPMGILHDLGPGNGSHVWVLKNLKDLQNQVVRYNRWAICGGKLVVVIGGAKFLPGTPVPLPSLAKQPPSPGGNHAVADQESVEKPKTFELRNVIFDLDEDELGKRDIKAWRIVQNQLGSDGWDNVRWICEKKCARIGRREHS